jgi:hypothetical protein
MDAEVLTTIAGVATATKTTIEAVRAALAKSKANQETLALVADLQARILQLQEIAFRLHQEKAQAFEENAKLRADIRRKEEGATDRENYERRNVRNSAVVVRKDEPDSYLCATCFEAGRKVYLSKLPFTGVKYRCPTCRGVL